MYRKQINKRSPFRVFERSIHGGLGPGNIGVVMGRTGVGKAGFLVGIALDELMRGQKVLHVSSDWTAEKVRGYYDEIFHELATSTELEDRDGTRLEIATNRMIHIFRDGFSLDRVRGALAYMREHVDFDPSMVVITGYPDWENASVDEIRTLKELAAQNDFELWLSAQTHRDDEDLDERGVPRRIARFDDFLSVVVRMVPQSDHVHLELVKDHESTDLADLHIQLDPTSLLVKWH